MQHASDAHLENLGLLTKQDAVTALVTTQFLCPRPIYIYNKYKNYSEQIYICNIA